MEEDKRYHAMIVPGFRFKMPDAAWFKENTKETYEPDLFWLNTWHTVKELKDGFGEMVETIVEDGRPDQMRKVFIVMILKKLRAGKIPKNYTGPSSGGSV